ncbi:MAG TPA: VCBS repeat-containing protein [Armatimonadota bacterium]|nr:VCBS repeat-containing protein [Armatimonadota bacterium]
MSVPTFTRVCIGELDNAPEMNTLFNVGDINRDGRPDIFSTGRSGMMAWFENRGDGSFERHAVDEVVRQECGGLAFDVDGDGWPDIINGGDWQSDELCWWRNPGPSGGRWQRRLITRTGFGQYHDEAIGDVTGGGATSLLFTNQGQGALGRVPLPADPTVGAWPDVEIIASGMKENGQAEEGLAIADLDGDGQNEVIFGCHWYRYAAGRWERHRYASGYITTVIAVGDVDGDGSPEILLSEGDPCIYGHPEGGKLAWFKPGADIRRLWTEHRIDENLLDAHSLQIADLCGAGRLDLVVGEIGIAKQIDEKPPRLFLYENRGGGRFERHLIEQGVGTHHARLADFRGCGALDIASRPLHGPDRGKIFVWFNDQGGRVG